jgi:hypothetical protein
MQYTLLLAGHRVESEQQPDQKLTAGWLELPAWKSTSRADMAHEDLADRAFFHSDPGSGQGNLKFDMPGLSTDGRLK